MEKIEMGTAFTPKDKLHVRGIGNSLGTKSMTVPNEEKYSLFNGNFPKGFRVIDIRLTATPKGVKQWFNAIYGLDIFIHKVPFLKVIVLANIIYWILN